MTDFLIFLGFVVMYAIISCFIHAMVTVYGAQKHQDDKIIMAMLWPFILIALIAIALFAVLSWPFSILTKWMTERLEEFKESE